MDNLVGLYTSMEGRIGRQQWWIGAIILGVVAFVIGWILGMVLGPVAGSWAAVVVGLVFVYPQICLSVKRRHDRDNGGMDAIAFAILSLIFNPIVLILGTQHIVTMIISVVFLIFAIYMLVQLGFLKGTTGPNQYGADPLGGGA